VKIQHALALILSCLALACANGGELGSVSDPQWGADSDASDPPADPDAGMSFCDGIDLDSDPQNCGLCGRTCVIPGGAAACVLGECAVASCEPGFIDEDGVVDNGCEVEAHCVAGEVCATSCGSEGRLSCTAVGAVCEAPLETCNLADDDCDGSCDVSVHSCRVGVYRAHGNGHLFTTNRGAASASPFRIEAENYFYLYASGAPSLSAAHLCQKPNGKFFLTSNPECELGIRPTATLGYWASSEVCGAVPLYRLYNGSAQNHFYTISAGERDNAVNNLGYRFEAVAGWVWTSG